MRDDIETDRFQYSLYIHQTAMPVGDPGCPTQSLEEPTMTLRLTQTRFDAGERQKTSTVGQSGPEWEKGVQSREVARPSYEMRVFETAAPQCEENQRKDPKSKSMLWSARLRSSRKGASDTV